MSNVLVGAYTYAEFGACLAAILPAVALSHVLHRNEPVPRLPGRWIRRVGRTAARLTPLWDFSVDGVVPPDIDHRAYVVVANHESAADPFLLSFLPWDMRWIAKEELFRVPMTGWIMSLGGDIPLRRGERDSVREMFDECKRTLAGGLSVMIFPEGTRSRDGRLLPFKEGAFRLAIEAGVPILPVALAGTRNARPKGSRWFGQARAMARSLPAVPTEGLRLEDLPTLLNTVRMQIAENVDDLRTKLCIKELPSAGSAPTVPVDVAPTS